MSAQPIRLIETANRLAPKRQPGPPLESCTIEELDGTSVAAAPSRATEVLLGEALEALERDEPATAARRLAGVLQNEPDNAEALLALGSIQHMQGDASAAAESYRRAATADPAGWQSRYNHALLKEAAGETGEAVAMLLHAIALAPPESLPPVRLALILEAEGRLEEARVWWRRAVATDPSHTFAWLRLGLLELKQGHLPEAASALENALRGEQEASDAAYHLALAYIAMGAAEEAAGVLAEALRQAPAAPDVLAAAIALALDCGDGGGAELLERALRESGATPAVLSYRLAQFHAASGAGESAREHYLRAVQSDSSLALGYFALTLEY